MDEQEKSESLLKLLNHLEDSSNEKIAKKEKEIKEYEKHAEQSGNQNSIDTFVKLSKADLSIFKNDLVMIRQAKALSVTKSV